MIKSENYQIVFSDVDGTLLNKDRELSEFTVNQIRKSVHNHNITFVMVSARMPAGMEHLYEQLSVESPIICYNGALILKSLSGGYNTQNIIHSNSIDFSIALGVYRKISNTNCHFGIFSNNNWYVNKIDEWTIKEENNTRVESTSIQNTEKLIDNLAKLGQPFHKLMVMGKPTEIDIVNEQLKKDFNQNIEVYRSKESYLEISPITSNKANACTFLMNKFGFSAQNAIAFGDNFNDIEMLKTVGLGVAMENAIVDVKIHAKLVTTSNTSDGVAHILSEIFG